MISIALLAILLASGALASSGAFSQSPPSNNVQQSSTSFPAAPPTFVGTSGVFLSGPTLVSSVFGGPSNSPSNSVSDPPASASGSHTLLLLNPKPGLAQTSKNPSNDPPRMGCSACDSISVNSGGATTNAFTLNAVQNFQAFGYTIEPPDQALCANSQYVLESLNIGIVQVYSASNLKPISGVVSLDNLMGLTAKGWGSAGDVSCLYDPGNGGHWFIIEIASASPEPESPFIKGCFVATPGTCMEGIAVSSTSNPLTSSWNVYFLNPNLVNSDPGSAAATGSGGYLLNDFAKIGTTKDAFMIFYDEFNLNPATAPPSGFGASTFNGAQEFAFSKNALETGKAASTINVAYENMGTASNLYPIPANGGFQPGAFDCTVGVCWYEVIPAQTPDASQFDNNNGGTGWMVGSLDFFGVGDNRIAAFDWTGLSDLNSASCKACGGIMFGGTLYTTPQIIYRNEGAACLVQYGGFCGLAPQKSGPIPLGDNCGALVPTITESCPESGLATNGDGATQASYADGQLWTAVSTVIEQTFGRSSELHIGAAFWAIGSSSVTSGGYVTATHEDLEFPAIAATDGGNALMSFTLSGPDYYPSSAYTMLTTGSRSNVIQVTALGKSPQDGFTEYQGFPGLTRPRWGDYGAAIFVPSAGAGGPGNSESGRGSAGTVYFASEYIQYPNCSDQAYISGVTGFNGIDGLTCGGTRTLQANWGSSISSVSAP